MNTDELKKVIAKNIKANGKGEITGPVLQSVLIDMVNGLQTDGLGFLGIINPGDPAPSNEKVNGYYLSFAVNDLRYPRRYFNGAKLSRYCMFIWTQDESGKWKFKRIKYEYHTREDALVVGRGLPIWYNEEDGTYTIHLSPDGTMRNYAVCGFSPLRKVGNSFGRSPAALNFPGTRSTPIYIAFRPEDDGKTFTSINVLREFILTRKKNSCFRTKTASPNYTILYNGYEGEARILWTPQKFLHPVYFKRIARNQLYFDATSKWASRRDINRNWWIKWRMCDPRFEYTTGHLDNGIIRDSKRPKDVKRRIKRGGMSDNFIVYSNGFPNLPYWEGKNGDGALGMISNNQPMSFQSPTQR